jgi:hypothetical protein
MKGTFAVLQEGFGTVIVQFRPITHVGGLTLNGSALRAGFSIRAARSNSFKVSRKETRRARLTSFTRIKTSSSRVTVVLVLMMSS